jgi:pilus assembly protein CpaB
MRRRIVLLAVAVLIAALGAGMVAVYVNGASGTPPAAATTKEKLVKVLTATSLINVGETAGQAQSEGKIALTPMSSASVVTGALTSIDTMADQVALSSIYPGEQILALKFGATVASETLLPVPKGKVAISVELTDPGRVAGFVTPGSHVAIFVTFTNSGGDTGPESFTRILVTDVVVIGVGPTTVLTSKDAAADPSSTAVAQTVLTVPLSQRDADLVTFAASNDVLSFGLLGTGTKLTSDDGVSQQDLLK